MVVLSLFDGISCGRVALEEAGVSVDQYFASEIDKYAIKVVSKVWGENVIEIGDVTKVTYKDGILHTVNGDFNVPKIDMIIGGSPCQGFSNAGKRLNFEDPRSKLFFEYVRILHEVNPEYFLLENVVMKKEWQDIISNILGVQPVLIDSALVSAAHRRRLYWTNINDGDIPQPTDQHVTFGDIRERNVPDGPIYYSDSAMKWIHNHEKRTGKMLRIITDDNKMQMLEASMYKKYSSQRFFGIKDTFGLRYITVRECERCMGLPDGYTWAVSNTQAYKQLGNGWNVDTITHIFSFL